MSLILDVRTPAEVAEAHLEGALFVDFMADDFRDKVVDLDKSADYIVHCRSGNRSGQAVVIMAELGFTGELVNGGTLDEAAAATGANIVQQYGAK
jgi:rhodanese-related sulfurtransferase